MPLTRLGFLTPLVLVCMETSAASKATCETQSTSMLSVKTVKSPRGWAQQEPKTIKEIFEETKTDKLWRHGYHRYYETQLAPYRDVDGLRLLEIGADSGISLAAWMEYFFTPAAVQGIAYGVDAKQAKKKACDMMLDQCDKLAIYSLDQSDKTALTDMAKQNPEGWDIVIDDGSHYPGHQIISFQQLWPKIRPGGMYVVEDIESSYVDTGEVYGYQLKGGINKPPPDNAVEQFKRLADVVSRKHFGQNEFSVFGGIDQDVADVDFADGIIFIRKKPADPDWDKYPSGVVFTRTNTDNSFQSYQQKLKAENMEEKLKKDTNNKN